MNDFFRVGYSLLVERFSRFVPCHLKGLGLGKYLETYLNEEMSSHAPLPPLNHPLILHWADKYVLTSTMSESATTDRKAR